MGILLGGLTDLDLARALGARDSTALEQLYDRYGGLAFSVAVRILGDHARAEDVVQEAFLKVWDSSSRFDPEKGSLRTWLLTVVRNRALDHLRGRRGREREERELAEDVLASGAGSDPWQEVSLTLQREAVTEALGRLPPEQRQAVELAYFGGYTHREIAEMTRIPLGSVKGRMRLAMEKMHSYLLARGLVDV
ncbi:MAG: sigma-70 family RNA polymerase sigma factor [Candidatus Dormibacteraceae bacterium]